MNSSAPKEQFKLLDKRRRIMHAGVVFDTSVIRANDEVAERELLELAGRFLEDPDRGDIWFSLISLWEMLATNDVAKRVDLLKRFQSLYKRFGDRIRFFKAGSFPSVVAEWNGTDPQHVRADAIESDVKASIAAGDLVGKLKDFRDEWGRIKKSLWNAENAARYKAIYESDPAFRKDFEQWVSRLGTASALDLCDAIAKRLIVEFVKRPEKDLELAKTNPADYPCTWTWSLLHRIADYAATLPPGEWNKSFAQYGRLLKSDENDYVDAYIASTGGACGMLITNDKPLIEKLNFLHDAQPPLVRLQAFTVHDALKGYNPPNGDKRDRTMPTL